MFKMNFIHTIKRNLFLIIATISIVMISQGVIYAADTTISGNACSIRYWDSPTWIAENLRYIWNIESKFYANKLTDGKVKTVSKKNIKQSRIRLYETLKGIKNGKDEQKYSAVAPNKKYALIYTFLSMRDSIVKSGRKTVPYYEWYYF
ncbi:MAG: hypothetical protein QME42_06675 [bacterium]|nr:hypothetical protein [bacterium]